MEFGFGDGEGYGGGYGERVWFEVLIGGGS